MEDHFRKLLTLLQAVQLFDTYSFPSGFLSFNWSHESGPGVQWSLMTCLLHGWDMVEGRWHQRLLGAGLACHSSFYGFEAL